MTDASKRAAIDVGAQVDQLASQRKPKWPQTRKGRALLVFGIIALVAAVCINVVVAVQAMRDPDNYYWYTLRDGSLGREVMPYSRAAIMLDRDDGAWTRLHDEIMREHRARCDMQFTGPGIPIVAKYRGVDLCNSAKLPNESFRPAHEEFKASVDRHFDRNVNQALTAVGVALLEAAGATVAFWGILTIIGWVARGRT